jgi:hypothetical protein
VLGYVATAPRSGIRVEVLGAEMRQRLPNGSSRAEVRAWLASHGVKASDIFDAAGRKVGLTATLANDSWLESAEITLDFTFDDRGRLTSSTISRFICCL